MKIGNLEVYGIIYDIRNKINNKHYIGQTARDFKKRYFYNGDSDIERIYNLNKAVKEKGNGYYNPHLVSSIEKYGFENFEVNRTLDVAFSKEELDIKEKVWIGIFDSFKKGYNRNLGGLGNKGAIRISGKENPSSRSVIQLSLEGDFIKQWDCITDIYRELKIGATDIVGVCSSKLNNRKSAGGFIWIYENEYEIDKDYIYINESGEYNKKAVVQLSLKGEYVQEFNSISEASRVVKGTCISKITNCCSNKRKSNGNYMWVYKENYSKDNIYKWDGVTDGEFKAVIQLSLDGSFIKEHNSLTEATKNVLSSSISKISSCCNNKRKSHANFIWIFKSDYNSDNDYKLTTKHRGKDKEVVQLSLEGNFIKKYPSVSIAKKESKIIKGNIYFCLTSGGKSAGGYKWMYYEEYLKQINI